MNKRRIIELKSNINKNDSNPYKIHSKWPSHWVVYSDFAYFAVESLRVCWKFQGAKSHLPVPSTHGMFASGILGRAETPDNIGWGKLGSHGLWLWQVSMHPPPGQSFLFRIPVILHYVDFIRKPLDTSDNQRKPFAGAKMGPNKYPYTPPPPFEITTSHGGRPVTNP